MSDDWHIKIFDTTLRDGQQCPGAGMSFEKNIEYARLAHKLRVDVLEAGFPSASAVDFEIVRTIASEFANQPDSPVVAALCQLREEQVVKTIEALKPASPFGKALLHVYVPVDPELMPFSLGDWARDKKAIINDLHRLVKMASNEGMQVEFSPEGYSRMGANFDFVTELIRAAVGAGASVINCPDTIGGASTFEGEEYFVNKMNRHAQIIKAEFANHPITWSVHCHNDFGLAVQNSCNAVFHGPARQIEGCINGIGERAGNAALEQCIMVIEHFAKIQVGKNGEKGFYTTIAAEHLQAISDFVGKNMLPRQPHSPVCGENAAKHSSGGHTNAVLKNPLAYQPFDPRRIGKEISFLFGPMSGGNHAKSIIESFGFRCDDEEKSVIAQYIKDHHKTRRKGITDRELIEVYFQYRSPIAVDHFDYSRSKERCDVTFHGKFFGQAGEIHESHEGKDSALAALKKAIEKHIGRFELLSHRSQSDVSGIDANSVSKISIVSGNGTEYEGTGVDRDIEISAMKALIDAINHAYVIEKYSLPSERTGGAIEAAEKENRSVV
jgi:2-isopropylmalate synthase